MNIISNEGYCRWKTRNRNIIKKKNKKSIDMTGNFENLGGFVKLNSLVLLLALAVGSLYLYSMNGSAMQGYEVQAFEREIESLEEESENLRIKEAELNSLHKLEEERDNLGMQEIEDIVYIHNSNSMAFK